MIGTKEQPLRVSRFRDFLECPERFYLQEVEGARPKTRSGVAVMGTVRHRLLYHIHKEGIERFDKWVPEEWWVWATQALDTEVATGQDSDLPVYWKDEEKERRDFGTECMMIFPNYIKAPQNRECKVILAEAPFKVEINGVWFESQGIDQLRELPDGTLELLDFKTGDRRPDQLFIDLNTQLAIYAYAVWKGIFWGEGDIGGHTDPEMVGTSFRVGRLPDVASIYHLKDHEPYKRKTGDKEKGEERGPGRYVSKIPCSEARMKVLEEEVEKVFTAMRWDLRYRNPGACITCHVKESCLAGVLGDALTPEMMATIGEEDLDAE